MFVITTFYNNPDINLNKGFNITKIVACILSFWKINGKQSEFSDIKINIFQLSHFDLEKVK